jgi:hypothetical protein
MYNLDQTDELDHADVETVARVAAELGFEGTDVTPEIALGEYGFMARKGTEYVSDGRWDVLLLVPAGVPGGPGFKFVGLDADEHPTRHAIQNTTHELLRPLSYVDEPHGAEKTVELLHEYHTAEE